MEGDSGKVHRVLLAQSCPLPIVKDSQSKVRLICLADSAEAAGGTAIYAGRKLAGQDNWSCALLAAKSKLMKGTIPRNELSAI